MTRELRLKSILIALGILVCLYYVYPTIRWAAYTEQERVALAGDPAKNQIGTWKEEEMALGDSDFFGRAGFSLKKWFQGDRNRVINLGLDLQGGLYVILKVELDDAVRVQNQNTRERIKDTLDEKEIEYVRVVDTTPTTIELTLTNAAMAKAAITALKADLNYADEISIPDEPFNNAFTVRLKADFVGRTRVRALEQARRVVENRINELGLTEPSIQVQRPERIIVQLPGEKDPNRVLRLLKQTAKLEFHVCAPENVTERVINSIDRIKRIKDKLRVESGRVEEGGTFVSYKIEDTDTEYFKAVLADSNVLARIPENYVLLLGRAVPDESAGRVYREFALVERDVAIDGMSVKDAKVTLQSTAQDRQVALSLDGRGLARLHTTSRRCENLYKMKGQVSRLAIILDDVIYSAPTLITFIPNNPVIKGSFTERESADLALVLRSGALPAKMEIMQNQVVGASLGADSIRKGVISGIVGAALIAVFMIGYYLLAGLVANLALVLNTLILLAVLAFFRATLTLPGIAGVILTIGMAVDANVIIYERIREELAAGKELRAAIRDGFARAWVVIFDSNLTTIITAVILYVMGTGPIRGFGLTLMIGLAANLITAVFICRWVFDLMLLRPGFTTLRMYQLFPRPNIDFMGKQLYCITASLILIVAGMAVFGIRVANQQAAMRANKTQLGESLLQKPMYGIELTGGDMVRLQFSQPASVASIRQVLSGIGMGDSTIQAVGGGNQVLIRSAFNSSTNAVAALKVAMTDNPFSVLEEDRIGPAIGGDLVRKAMIAIVLSLIAMVIYLWFRFELEFGIGAMIALLHDVLVVVAFFALTGRQISLGVIASLLTIVGYSVNDTIVIFDRVRENLHVTKGMKLSDLMNLSINQTLSRTLLTSLLTLMVVVAQYLFGGEVINDFAFAMMIGIIAGSYSTVYIANPAVLFWNKFVKRAK